MNTKSSTKPIAAIGDWIEVYEGIAQVYGAQDYFVEEFFAHDFPEFEIGDIFTTKIVYRVFCNYEGKLRKTHFFNHTDYENCKPLDAKSLGILENLQQKQPEAYDKFKSRKPTKPLIGRLDISLLVEPESLERVKKELNSLIKKMDKPFTYAELESSVYKDIAGILSPDFSRQQNQARTNLLIGLVYEVLKISEGKFAFTGGVAVETYRNPDDY